MMMPDSLARASSALGATADLTALAPGRANLMGEHTDYNAGFVLPVALELRTAIAAVRADDRVRLRSLELPGDAEVDLRTGAGSDTGWGRYVAAVVRALRDEGQPLRGIDGVVSSDLPLETGLSSSAALEVAVALAVLDSPIDPGTLARLCQRAENEGVGVRSGIMDQLAATASLADHALLLDCRSVTWEPVPLPRDLRVVVVDSGERRRLDAGAYNRRREECEQAAARLGVATLRDATPEQVAAAGLPPPLDARARHVVTENERTLRAAGAVRNDDRALLERLFAASQASLAKDFEVSTPGLDALVEIAIETDGVVASRMTGAGFGGCTVNLVLADAADDAVERIVRVYRERTGAPARGWTSKASAGALSLSGA